MKKDKNNIFKILFYIIIFTAENSFYIFKNTKVFGILGLDDICLILSIVLGIYCYYKTYKIKKKYKINLIIILFSLLLVFFIFISSIHAYYRYNQPIVLGIRPQRFLLLSFIFYPLIRYFFAFPDIYKWIIKTIKNIGVFVAILYSIQYILCNKILFLNVYMSTRFGEKRLHFESIIISIAIFIVLQEILYEKKNRFKNCIYLGIFMFYNIFVIKGRLNLIGIILSIFIVLIILKYKYKVLILYSMTFIVLILSTSILYKIDNSIVYKYYNNIISEVNSNTGNYEIRVAGKEYILNSIEESKILGNGYISELYDKSESILGLNYGYKLIDNGITAIVSMYGYLGIIFFLLAYLIIFFVSLKLLRKKSTFYFGYILNLGIIMKNIIPLFWGVGPFYLGLLIALMFYKLKFNE